MNKIKFLFYKIKSKLLIPRIIFYFFICGLLLAIYAPFKLIQVILFRLTDIILEKINLPISVDLTKEIIRAK